MKLAAARRTHLVTRMAQKAMRRLEGVVQAAGDSPPTRAEPGSTGE